MSPRSERQFEAIRQKSREAILKASLKLFARKGYSQTTTADIARSVGISKGLIYNYFTSKEDILEALLEELIGTHLPMLSVKPDDARPENVIEEFIRGWFHIVRSYPDLVKLSVQIHTNPSLQRILRKKETEYFELFIPRFKKEFQRLGASDPEAETFVLGAMMDGISLNSSAMSSSLPLDRMEKSLIDRFCRSHKQGAARQIRKSSTHA